MSAPIRKPFYPFAPVLCCLPALLLVAIMAGGGLAQVAPDGAAAWATLTSSDVRPAVDGVEAPQPPPLVLPEGPFPPLSLVVPTARQGNAPAADVALDQPLSHDPATGITTLLPAPTRLPTTPTAVPGPATGPESWSDLPLIGPALATSGSYSPNCRLLVTFPDGSTYQGSGTLIDSRTVITAGHAVHQGAGGDWATSVIVSPGWDGDDDLASSVSGTNFITWSAWTTSGNPASDQGYIRLPEPLGFLASWYGYYHQPNDALLAVEPFSVAGFPTEGCWSGAPDQLHLASGSWDTVTADQLVAAAGWPCWMAGMDGAGAYRFDGGSRLVGGTLAYGSGFGGATYEVTATRLNATRFAYLDETYIPGGYPTATSDMTPMKARVVADVVDQGETMPLTFTLGNMSQFDPALTSYGFEVLFSTNGILSVADTSVGQYTVNWNFGPKGFTTVLVNVAIPNDLPTGDYWVGVRLTDFDANVSNDITQGWHTDTVKVIDPYPYVDLGSALPGVFGDPLMLASGDLTLGSLNALGVANAAPLASASIFLSLTESAVPFKGGLLKAFTLPVPYILLTTTTSSGGISSFTYTMPLDFPVGLEFYLQWVIADAAAIKGFSISNAIRGVTQ